MRILLLLYSLVLLSLVQANKCINKHCSGQEARCKEDKSELPCPTIINTCLDLCSTATSYSCISFCLSSRKNDAANKFLTCCSGFSCKVQKFTALARVIETNLQNEDE